MKEEKGVSHVEHLAGKKTVVDRRNSQSKDSEAEAR